MSQPILLLALWTALLLISSNAFPLHLKSFKCKKSSSALFAGENQDQPVQVYENTFNPTTCEALHYLTIEHNERTNDGSSFFTRPPHNDKALTPIEHAIDSALIEMGDKTRRVEYWSRDEYMNIDAHTDIDEAMLEDDGVVRCPLVAHVLYLQVKDGLHGPTCVFPKERIGWGLDEAEEDKKDLVIVPAVVGRILRFQGSAMHAVPNPAHRWLLSKQEEKVLRKEEEEENCDQVIDNDEEWLEDDLYDNDDDDDDDDDDNDDEVERSVLLFNTWLDDEPGPRGVDGDIATGALPEGIELSEEDAAAFLKSQEAQILAEWEHEYGKNGQQIRCNPFSEWESVDVQDIDIDTSSTVGEVHVSLMGMENRRLYPEKYARLKGPQEVIRTALSEDSKVSAARLIKDNSI
jgi:hypothetical protein